METPTTVVRSGSDSAAAPAAQYRLCTLGGLALLHHDGTPHHGLGTRPRKLALLAYLALAKAPSTRDALVGLFWGDRDDDRARHSLRDALSHLRRILGADAVSRQADSVLLDPAAPIQVDALELLAAAAAGEHERVLELYTGPFLDAVHVPSSHAFEAWAQGVRSTLERHFLRACRAEAARLLEGGEAGSAAAVAERWVAAAPLDADAVCLWLEALAAPRTAESLRQASAAYDRYAARLARDFELAPDARVKHLASELSARLAAQVERERQDSATTAGHASLPDEATVAPATPRLVRRRWVRAPMALAVVGGAVVALAGAWYAGRRAAPGAPVAGVGGLAIAPLDNASGDTADAWLATGVQQMLAGALEREGSLSVVPPSRIRELGAHLDTIGAHALGARWLASGGVTRGAGVYVIDMSLRDLTTRRDAAHFVVRDTGLFAAVDAAAARLFSELQIEGGSMPIARIETRSLAAYRAFIDGLRLTAAGRPRAAIEALDAAIALDSGFVSALIARRRVLGEPRGEAQLDSAARLERAYERVRDLAPTFDRLELDAMLAFYRGERARAEAMADSLVTLYPRDPRAVLVATQSFMSHGEFAKAAQLLERSIAGIGQMPDGDLCTSCAFSNWLVSAYIHMGELARAEGVARRATIRHAGQPFAWGLLSSSLASRGAMREASAAAERAVQLAPDDGGYDVWRVQRLIEARRYAAADSAARRWRLDGRRERVASGVDIEMMLLRERGRFAAAALLADSARDWNLSILELLQHVQGNTLGRLRDGRSAAKVYEALSFHEGRPQPGVHAMLAPSSSARSFAWSHALLADALYLAGDVSRLDALADSIEVVGSTSYYGRDWRLHHHVRGLLDASAGRWEPAERHFTAARWGFVGWSRTSVELANAQLEQGRPLDAIQTLRGAYAAGVDGMGRYVPRSELDWWMARAFAAAGVRDSARMYGEFVRSAWKDADPSVRARLALLSSAAESPRTSASSTR